jgi:hypothetical protein
MSGKRYSEVEVEKALIAAATLGIRPAARELDMPVATLYQWTQQQPERYAEIKTEEAPKWRARAAAGFEDIVEGLTEAENKILTRLQDRVDKLDDKDLARTLKDVSTSKGINSQHVHQLRGQPAQVIEHKVNLTLVQKAIEQLEKPDSVDSTAVEVEPSLPPAA